MEKHHPSSETRLFTTPRGPPPPRRIVTPLASTILAVLLFLGYYSLVLPRPRPPPSPQSKHQSLVDTVQNCAIDKLHEDLSFLDGAAPIATDEFLARRDRLAQALVASTPAVDAFVLEPGYAFQYYANTSQADWEPWEPEERPFLMLVLPEVSSSADGSQVVRARTAFLAPHFEEGRVRMLGIPSRASAELDIVVWEEHWDPYATLRASPLFAGFGARQRLRLMVDDEMRDFIVRGLGAAGFDTVGLGAAAEAVRQAKTPAEVALLRAVNTGTVAAVRAMRPCLTPGLTEDDVTAVLDSALLSVGFRLFFDIVLFEENGALPHGGFVTGGKVLTHESMVVIDVGTHYLGYSSDICRSFFIDPPTTSPSSSGDANGGVLAGLLRKVLGWWTGETATTIIVQWQPSDPALHAEKMRVWQIVLDAQTAAAQAFKPNASAASVDIAARTVIEDAGYGDAFTHRVGHGIGIKAHESPYLNKFNTEVLLQPGMTFTNEPGIYLLNRFGVRHEDIYLVKEDGEAELLSGQRATGPYDP